MVYKNIFTLQLLRESPNDVHANYALFISSDAIVFFRWNAQEVSVHFKKKVLTEQMYKMQGLN